MIMNFNTAPAAPAPAAPAASAPTPATAPSQAAALPGMPGYAGTGAAPSALPLFAQVLDVTGVATPDADTPAPAKDGDTDSPADSSLPAMAAPVIGLPVNMLPPADAAAAEARAYAQAQVQTQTQAQAQAQTQVQANVAQANPALNISLHPAAVTLNAPATAPAPGRDTREPLAAANPATPAKGSAPAQQFESLLQQSAPATAVAALPLPRLPRAKANVAPQRRSRPTWA
ncbi:Uncharacterised protein [Janthinobacterium lividum]|uniref:hypothetical protein n=1 Tax=Janthinobacterium lividum TaxID=29581 RepID=UPI000E050A75|nr:hypothetical protein [Janthinobacterium lividum]STQ92498.1 Uncharacterised protein [Janthinobacterium lividum]